MCPSCGQNAPIVYRGIAAYCTACGAPRLPLASKSVNLAGKPSQIGGTFTRVVGWLVLAGGLILSLSLMGILQAIFPEGYAGFATGGGFAVATGFLSWLLLRSGKSMKAEGDDEATHARVQAIYAMAPVRRGVLRASEVASALQIGVPEADRLLTELAKKQSDFVSLEIDDQGGVYYRVDPTGRVRMRVEALPYERVRVNQEPVLEPDEVIEPERARRMRQSP